MKLKFKTQAYQTAAVQAVVDCFKGQPPATAEAISYRIDPGKAKKGVEDLFAEGGFKNADLKLTDIALLENITQVQHQRGLAAVVRTGEDQGQQGQSRYRDGNRHWQDVLLHQDDL